jgi:hypothetical protein
MSPKNATIWLSEVALKSHCRRMFVGLMVFSVVSAAIICEKTSIDATLTHA